MSTAAQSDMFGQGSHSLTREDYEAVWVLLDEISRNERCDRIAQAIVTWQNALTVFRNVERRYGLPADDAGWEIYRAIIAELKAKGLWVKSFVRQENMSLLPYKLNADSLNACIEELEVDGGMHEFAANPEAQQAIEKHFAEK